MATHSSVLAWRIPGTGEPGGLLPMGSHRVGHDWSDLAVAAYTQVASLIAQLVKNPPAMQETPVQFLGQEDPLEKGWATHSSILGLPFGLAGKESACNAGDLGSIPGLGRFPGEGKGYPLQYSGLEYSMDCIVIESDTTEWLSLSYSKYWYLKFCSSSIVLGQLCTILLNSLLLQICLHSGN